jgi:hypothetical protein
MSGLEKKEFLAEDRRLRLVVFGMLRRGRINENERNTAYKRLAQARSLAEDGSMGEARHMVGVVADMIAGWREPKQ